MSEDLTTKLGPRWPDVILASASAVALALASWLVPAGNRLLFAGGDEWPLVCWLRLKFGLACPTCGLTRSVVASMHGDWAAAIGWHPAGPLLALGALIVVVLVVSLAVRRRPPLWGRPGFGRALSVVGGAVLWLGLVRLAMM